MALRQELLPCSEVGEEGECWICTAWNVGMEGEGNPWAEGDGSVIRRNSSRGNKEMEELEGKGKERALWGSEEYSDQRQKVKAAEPSLLHQNSPFNSPSFGSNLLQMTPETLGHYLGHKLGKKRPTHLPPS